MGQVIFPEITWMARKIIPQEFSAGNGAGNRVLITCTITPTGV